MFKTKCDEFLSSISSMRSSAISTAVNEALCKIHNPYVAEVNQTTNDLVEEEKKKTGQIIAKLQAELENKINMYRTDANNAIKQHREKISLEAETKAKANYDTFILGVSQLIDKTNI